MEGKRKLVEKWLTRWHDDQTARWTHCLISELATWLDTHTHTFAFGRSGMAREVVGRAVSAELTLDTMVSLMLQSEDF